MVTMQNGPSRDLTLRFGISIGLAYQRTHALVQLSASHVARNQADLSEVRTFVRLLRSKRFRPKSKQTLADHEERCKRLQAWAGMLIRFISSVEDGGNSSDAAASLEKANRYE